MSNQIEEKNEKKNWTKPSITPLKSGMLNKFGSVRHTVWRDTIDGIAVKDLVNDYGSPLFVVSEKKLRENFKRVHNAFTSRYPDVVMGWSYKTNYLGAICNTFHSEGAWAEVVSEFEYQRARSLGIPGHCIIFNGPHKSRTMLQLAITEGAHIHVDHLDELYLLEEIAVHLNRKVNVTIRLNFDTGHTEPWSRFGFNVESGQAMDLAWRFTSSQHLCLTGLHSHIGTFVLEPKAYQNQVKIMCNFMQEIEAKTHCVIKYLDIGGGFASMNSLQGIYLPPEQVVPSIEQYAEAICTPLLEWTHERESAGFGRPTLVLETGRALVDDTEVLISSVVANKHLADGRRGVVLDVGVNSLFTAFWYNHDVVPTRQLVGKPEDTTLYGPLCMNIDVIRSSIMLPPVEVGDTMIISPVGAYNNTQWMQFIEYRPNVVMVLEDGTVALIRKAEDLQAVIGLEQIPEKLKTAYPNGAPPDKLSSRFYK